MHTDDRDIIVGFDLDGVIIDHTQNKIRFAARYGIVLTPEQTHAEVMGKYFSPELYKEIKGQLYDFSPEAIEAPLMEGAFDGLARLKEKQIRYFLVSLQKKPMHALHLLEERGLWGTYFTPENTFFASNGEEKHQIAASLGVTHFVDDEPNILELMLTIEERILFDPRDLFPEKTDYTHVGSWPALVDLLGAAHG